MLDRDMYILWHFFCNLNRKWNCGVCVVGKMSKDIGMGIRKGTMVSFVSTLFGCFLGIPSLYVFSFSKILFCDLFQLFFWGGGVVGEWDGDIQLLTVPRYSCIATQAQVIGSDDS